MCVEAFIAGQWLHTQGELAASLGCDLSALQFHAAAVDEAGVEHNRHPDHCLCPVDGAATAAALGWRFQQHGYDENWFGEMEFLR